LEDASDAEKNDPELHPELRKLYKRRKDDRQTSTTSVKRNLTNEENGKNKTQT